MTDARQPTVAIAGAGLGGLAAAIFLRRAGLEVVCIEAEPFPHARVGESLDWSSPALLEALGLPRDQIIQQHAGTYKRNIRVNSLGRRPFFGKPRPWFTSKPLQFEITTLHVDRPQMDQRLFEIARDLGTRFIWERIAAVETNGRRVAALTTSANRRVEASWFIDGSGQATLFSKAFSIPKTEYGRRKICLWTYFDDPMSNEGTTFYGDNRDDYLAWIWEIPITETTVSIGLVMSAEQLKQRRVDAQPARQLLHEALARHPRFTKLLADQPIQSVRTCSYRSYVCRRVCGPNWFAVGEAASLPDPLTANGVTAAFRHGRDAAGLIGESSRRGSLSRSRQHRYSAKTRGMGQVFNHSIERSAYESAMRWGLGEKGAEQIYTIFSYLINALYSRLQPQGRVGTRSFGFLLFLVHVWMETWSLIARFMLRVRGFHQVPAEEPSPQPVA